MKRIYEDGPHGQIHARVAGKDGHGVPLLMLHPTPKSGWIFEPLVTEFGTDRFAMAPDTPGYGASDPPAAPGDIQVYVEAMIALLDAMVAKGHIKPGPVDVLGYHTGSATAVALAQAHPHRVRRLVLVALPAFSADVRAQKIAALANWPRPVADGGHLTAMWRLVRSFLPENTDLVWTNASVVENLRSGVRAPWGYDAVYRFDMQTALQRLAHPTLVLDPGDDLHPTTEASRAFLPAGTRYVALPHLRHGLFEFATAEVCGHVRDFLDDRTTA